MESDEEHADDLEDEAFTAIANELLEKCNLPGRVTRIEECSDNFFVGVYKGLLGDDLPGIVDNPVTSSQHIENCQTVIDTVSTEVLCVDLSHISGRSIVEGDRVSIRNLLEIFAGLLELFMECVDGQTDSKDSDEDDSNLLTSEHDIISGVLREELGPSYQEVIGPRPSNLSEPPQRGVYDSHQQRSVQQSVNVAPQGPAEKNQAKKLKIDMGTKNGNSTGFEADTSKLTDSTTDIVSDSTAELIRLGESGSVRPSKATDTKGTNSLIAESLSNTSISLDSIGLRSYDPHRRGACRGVKDGTRSKDTPLSVPFYDEDEAKKQGVRVSEADSSQASGVARRSLECPSAEDGLTQYSLTSADIRQVNNKDVQKDPSKLSSSFLSASTASASWPDQISPLESARISAGGGSGEFEALGVRPKEQPAPAEGSDGGTGGSSGRSTPVYHHYHHHFHHTQPQLGVPGFQPVAGVSAAAAVDLPGTTSSLTRHGPSAAIARPLGTGPIGNDRLVHTAPAAVTLPHTAASAPERGMVSIGGLTYPPSTAGTRTQSSLTDSVFLSASGSGRPPLERMAIASMPSNTVSGTGSLRERPRRPLPTTVTSTDPSLPLSRTAPSTSYPRHLPLGSNLDGRVQGNIPPDRWAHSVDTLPTRQRLASTFPQRPLQSERLKPRITDIDPPTIRRNKAADLLAKHKKSETGDSDRSDHESESDIEDEDEELAQNSDSAVDYGRRSTAKSKTLTARTQKRIEENENTRSRRGYRADSTEDDTSPELPARRGVTFRDTVETFPVSGRMDRLRHLLYKEAEEERKQHTTALRKGYRNQLREIQQSKEMNRDRHSKRKIPLSPNVPKKKPRKKTTLKQRGRLENVYCSQDRRSRPTKKSTTKVRKRSASASPVLRRNRRMSDSDHPEALLPTMLEEFPFLHVSPQTARSMWRKQSQHLSSILKSDSAAKKTKTQRMIEDAERRQQTLVGILKKDLEHNIRMREKQDRQQQQQTIRAKLREKRQISARARRYYDEYELRMRARMLKRRTREEQIFKRLFQDGLDLQKQRIRELREYAKEKRESLAQRQQNEIESLENFYRDQFAMLSEGIARERYELEVREKAQEKVVRQMRRDLRQKLEHDVKEFQDNLQRDEDSAYFRQLEADRLRREFQLATRNASTNRK